MPNHLHIQIAGAGPAAGAPHPALAPGDPHVAQLVSLVKPRAAPRKPLKALHVVTVPRHKVCRTMWGKAEIHERPVDLDHHELELFFAAKKPETTEAARKKPETEGEKVKSFLEDKRNKQLSIPLAKFKLPIEAVREGIESLDSEFLSSEQFLMICDVFPTEKEVVPLVAYEGDLDKLEKADRFVKELLVLPDVHRKLRCFAYTHRFHEDLSDITRDLLVILDACTEILHSQKFKRLFVTILAVANFLNQGTAKAMALGFKIESLAKLSDTKSTVQERGVASMLHYLAHFCFHHEPDLLAFPDDLPSLDRAVKVSVPKLLESLTDLRDGLQLCKDLARATGPTNLFAANMRSFVYGSPTVEFPSEGQEPLALEGSAGYEMQQVLKVAAQMTTDLGTLGTYLGEETEGGKGPVWDELFLTLHDFITRFKAARKDVEAEEEKETALRRLHKTEPLETLDLSPADGPFSEYDSSTSEPA